MNEQTRQALKDAKLCLRAAKRSVRGQTFDTNLRMAKRYIDHAMESRTTDEYGQLTDDILGLESQEARRASNLGIASLSGREDPS